MTETPMRSWVCKAKFPKLKPFYAGTIFVRLGAPDHEVKAEAEKWLAEVVPAGFEITDMVPGMLVFYPEEEARKAA